MIIPNIDNAISNKVMKYCFAWILRFRSTSRRFRNFVFEDRFNNPARLQQDWMLVLRDEKNITQTVFFVYYVCIQPESLTMCIQNEKIKQFILLLLFLSSWVREKKPVFVMKLHSHEGICMNTADRLLRLHDVCRPLCLCVDRYCLKKDKNEKNKRERKRFWVKSKKEHLERITNNRRLTINCLPGFVHG